MSRAPLKIAIITQYFYPESFIINDIVRELTRQGQHVEVFTGKPNYPSGKVYEGYSEDGYRKESFFGSVTIHRAPLRPRHAGGAKNLALNYLSFVLNGIRYFPLKARRSKFDVYFVFAMSPITAAIPAIAMKVAHRAPLFVWVQDLWPESLEATGFVKNKLVLKGVGLLVRAIYAAVDVLLVQSQAFTGPVSGYARRDKIQYYPNSYPQDDNPSRTPQLPAWLTAVLRENFCVVFAGNMGTAQALPTIVEAAQYLKQQRATARIVMVGTGSSAEWLAGRKEALGLDNMILAGAFPKTAMAELFELSSALLVTLKKEEIFSYTIPSKVQAYLAAGRPIIGSLDGEGARIISEAGAGLTCPAGDGPALAASIVAMQALSADQRRQLGDSGRAYYNEYFELKAQCKKLIELFEKKIPED